MERTHTEERYGHRRSQIKKFVEKTEEHSSRRFAELPGIASDTTDHAEGGPYNSKGGPYSFYTDFILLT